MSSARDSAFQLFQTLYSQPKQWGSTELLSHLGSVIGARHDAGEVTRYVQGLASLGPPDGDSWRAAGLSGIARGLRMAGVSGLKAPAVETALAKMLDSPSERVQDGARDVARHIELRALIQKAVRAGNARPRC